MFELLLVVGVGLFSIAVLIAAFTVIAFVFRALLWLVLLPIKLVIGAIMLIGSLVGALVLIPVAIVLSLLAIPLLPLLAIGAVLWLVLRRARPVTA